MSIADGTGVITPLLTPLNQDESINYDQLGALVEHVVAGGCDAVLAMGSTGEFARFTTEVRATIMAEVVKNVGGRIPVYAGVGDTGLKRVLRNVALAEKAGADALAVTLPYYYPIRNDREAFMYYEAVVKSTSLPVMLYNIPSTCGASLSFAVIDQLLQFDNVIGIKDSSGDLDRLLEEIRRYRGKAKRFTVVAGSEELTYAGFIAGADGVVPSMANPFPQLWAAIYRAAREKDDAQLRALCATADELNQINSYVDAWMSPNVWRKRALHHMGICNDICTAPYVPIDAETDKKIIAAVAKYNKVYGCRV